MSNKKSFISKHYDHSIQAKVVTIMLSTIISLSIILGIISGILNLSSSIDVLDQTMTEMAKIAGGRVSAEVSEYIRVMESIGNQSDLSNPSKTPAEKQDILNKALNEYNISSAYILDSNGTSSELNLNLSSEEYVKQALTGKTYISSPHLNAITNEMAIVLASPIMNANGSIDGVIVAVTNSDFVNRIVTSIDVGNNGGAYIIDKNGTILSDKDSTRIGTINMIEIAKTDSSSKKQAEIEQKMINGESGIGKLTSYKGATQLVAYSPVPDTDGWSIGIYATQSDYFTGVAKSIFITIIFIIIFIIVGSFISKRFARLISEPITRCVKRLEDLANGDLTSPAPDVNTNDELKLLSNATGEIVEDINKIIKDVDYLLGSMANGDFQIRTKAEEAYRGDFSGILMSIRTINTSLSHTLFEIKESIEQVSEGAEQMAVGAQNLAEGSTEQSGAVEKLVCTIADVSKSVDESAKIAKDTSKNTKLIGDQAKASTSQMSEMIDAMERISNASNKIEDIIQTIESIAEQTNLLSLNASIEAARAGEAGKGFAVVAGEIGQLAKQSSEAVDETRKLITTALSEVENGTGIVEATNKVLDTMIEKIYNTVDSINNVSLSVSEQTTKMEAINEEIEQISTVIQTNSATAEESSATTEQLSAQAINLKGMIDNFKLKEL